jgi:hypothetical protein
MDSPAACNKRFLRNRRRLRQVVVGCALALALGSRAAQVNAENNSPYDRYDTWYFTAEELSAAYSYQEGYGARLPNALRAGGCLFRDGEFAAKYGAASFAVPCNFVHQITRHLREMLDQGAAKFLFPLDADHAHLGVPMAAWKEKYQHLPPEKVVAALLRDPGLVALYHTAEHLRVTDRATGAVNQEAKAWQEKRNVLGYFDGRPNQILQPHPTGQGAPMPQEYYSYSGFSFLASPRGEIYLSIGTKIVMFDIAFDATPVEEFAEAGVFSETQLIRTNR